MKSLQTCQTRVSTYARLDNTLNNSKLLSKPASSTLLKHGQHLRHRITPITFPTMPITNTRRPQDVPLFHHSLHRLPNRARAPLQAGGIQPPLPHACILHLMLQSTRYLPVQATRPLPHALLTFQGTAVNAINNLSMYYSNIHNLRVILSTAPSRL